MQPGLTTSAKPILMDRFAIQAPNAHQKVINLMQNGVARAQGTKPFKQKSANGGMGGKKWRCTRVRCLDCRISFSQNAKLLSPQGLF